MTRAARELKDWTFRGFSGQFDGHVREQLPWYDMATAAVAMIARHYIPQGGKVYDLGCSTGNIGRVLAPTLHEREAPARVRRSRQRIPDHTLCRPAGCRAGQSWPPPP